MVCEEEGKVLCPKRGFADGPEIDDKPVCGIVGEVYTVPVVCEVKTKVLCPKRGFDDGPEIGDKPV